MKITVRSLERKLVAVRSLTGNGLFFAYASGSILIDDLNNAEVNDQTLQELVDESEDRTPIYEGDIVTLQF